MWELREISKSFPGVRALAGVSLELRPGEIHALIGENGSGKSTLAKVLSGVHSPEAGRLVHLGEPVELHVPTDARLRGVATIHQELSLVPTLRVAENIYLGRLPRRGPLVHWRAAEEGAEAALLRLRLELDPNREVASLSVAQQQLVEIAKAISLDMSLLVLDEPTAALGPTETRRLHEVIRRLADQGTAILYISHRLDEVLEIADVVTVLRDGRRVVTAPRRQVTMRDLIRAMIGTDVDDYYRREGRLSGEPRLELRAISSDGGVIDATFTVHQGEVLGLGGVVGSRRTEIARVVAGADRVTAGEILLDGRHLRLRSPQDALRAGIALVPENRRTEGLFLNFAAAPNITVADLGKLRALGPLLNLRREQARTAELVDELGIVGPTGRRVGFLSGGNQQKVVLARWLFSEVKVLILDEPTQGIDVQAKLEVYRVIGDLTARGMAVLLISSDYPELLAISDRVAVVRQGRVVHQAPAADLTESELIELASGRGAAA
ncbi:MAG: sugar ABC transporter ATP-binding protein [Acidimicrobiia bacterium]